MTLDETTLGLKPARAGFAADVSSAARALVSQPTVVLVSIATWCLPALMTTSRRSGPPPKSLGLFMVNVALALFIMGWLGAERVFFLRQFEGRPATLRHLLKLVKPFMGRFLALGFASGLGLLLGLLGLAIVCGGFPKPDSTKFRVGTMSLGVALDFVLTFVPAALALTTRSVRRALRIGFALIRQTWPRCALYVLCPPLALGMNSLVFPTDLPMLRLIVAGSLAVVALLAKGATVAFYIRERPVYDGIDGAAYVGETDEPIVA